MHSPAFSLEEEMAKLIVVAATAAKKNKGGASAKVFKGLASYARKRPRVVTATHEVTPPTTREIENTERLADQPTFVVDPQTVGVEVVAIEVVAQNVHIPHFVHEVGDTSCKVCFIKITFS